MRLHYSVPAKELSMKVNRFLHKFYALFDCRESKDVDPTPSGIPLIFLIVIVPIMLAAIVALAYFYL
jgi:hypothetical protein